MAGPLLDVRTLLVATAVVFLALGGVTVFFWRENRTVPGLGPLAFAHVTVLPGALLVALRGPVPLGLSVCAGNVAVVLATSLLLEGFQRLYDRPPSRWLETTSLAAVGLGMPYFLFVRPDTAMRVAIVSLAMGALLCRAAWTASGGARAEAERGPSLLNVVALALLGVLLAARGGAALAGVGAEFPGTSAPAVLSFTAAMASGIGWTVGTLTLVGNRQRESARQANEAIATLLESAPDAMVVVDRGGRIVRVNSQAEVLFGYGREELLGRPVEMLVPPRYAGAHVGHREAFGAAPAARSMGLGRDLWALRKDGREFPVEISLAPIRAPEGTLISSAIRDSTERRLAETRLRRQGEYLASLHETALAVMHDLELGPLLEALVRRASSLLGAVHGFIYLERPDASALECRVWVGDHPMDAQVGPGEGAVGRAWREGEPQLADDYDAWAGRSPQVPRGIFGSMVAVPLVFGGRTAGAIGLAHQAGSTQRFTPDDVRLLSAFGQLAAIAVDNARLFERERAARHEAERLLDATRALGSTMELGEVLERILSELVEVVPYESLCRAASLSARRIGAPMAPALAAARAPQPRKAPAQEPAVEVRPQLLAGALGDAHRDRPVVDRAVQRLEVVAHQLVERRRLGPLASVDSGGGAAIRAEPGSGRGAAQGSIARLCSGRPRRWASGYQRNGGFRRISVASRRGFLR